MNKKRDDRQAWEDAVRTLPLRVLVSEIMIDATPEMDDLAKEIMLLDGANSAIMGHESKASNQEINPIWLREIAAIVRGRIREIEAYGARRRAKKKRA